MAKQNLGAASAKVASAKKTKDPKSFVTKIMAIWPKVVGDISPHYFKLGELLIAARKALSTPPE